MNIGIVGQGFVGSAIREGLQNFYNVSTYDIDNSKCSSTLEEVVRDYFKYGNENRTDDTQESDSE